MAFHHEWTWYNIYYPNPDAAICRLGIDESEWHKSNRRKDTPWFKDSESCRMLLNNRRSLMPDAIAYNTLIDQLEIVESRPHGRCPGNNVMKEDLAEHRARYHRWDLSGRGQLFVEVLLLAAVTVCGSAGNLLVLLSTLLYKYMRTTSNIILSLQATCDLVLCCAIPLVMVVRVTEQWTLGNMACKIWMFIFTFSQGNTTLCMSALAIDRYLCICRPQSYNFLKRRPYVTVVIILLISLCISSPFIIGWNTLTIQKDGARYTFCGLRWPNGLDNKAYIFIILFFDFFIPLFLTIILYSIIWLQVRDSAKRVVNVTTNRSTGTAGAKLLKILMLSVFLYMLMFLPFVAVSVLLFFSDAISSSVFLVILGLLVSNTVVNPILLPVFNSKYRTCMTATARCRKVQDPRKAACTVQRSGQEHIQNIAPDVISHANASPRCDVNM